jgi:hypothetical protein
MSIPVDSSKPKPDIKAALAGAQVTGRSPTIERASPVKVAVGKPKRDAFFRVRADQNWLKAFDLLQIEATNDRLVHILAGEGLAAEAEALGGKVFVGTLYFTCTTHGHYSFWPVPFESLNDWHTSARECAFLAQQKWIKVVSDKIEGRWVAYEAQGIDREPIWPGEDTAESYLDILSAAFGDLVVADTDHPVFAQLQGLET